MRYATRVRCVTLRYATRVRVGGDAVDVWINPASFAGARAHMRSEACVSVAVGEYARITRSHRREV
eukprot:48164-Prorocentrum_minimum.AAC.5